MLMPALWIVRLDRDAPVREESRPCLLRLSGMCSVFRCLRKNFPLSPVSRSHQSAPQLPVSRLPQPLQNLLSVSQLHPGPVSETEGDSAKADEETADSTESEAAATPEAEK